MAPRQVLHQRLKDLTPNVYFEPPTNVQMKYPCIVYTRARAETVFADNLPYFYNKKYTVTVMDQDPDSEIPDKVAFLPQCTHSSFYVADRINHNVFDIVH